MTKFTIKLVLNEFDDITPKELEEDVLDILEYYGFNVVTFKIEKEKQAKPKNEKRNDNTGAGKGKGKGKEKA